MRVDESALESKGVDSKILARVATLINFHRSRLTRA